MCNNGIVENGCFRRIHKGALRPIYRCKGIKIDSYKCKKNLKIIDYDSKKYIADTIFAEIFI